MKRECWKFQITSLGGSYISLNFSGITLQCKRTVPWGSSSFISQIPLPSSGSSFFLLLLIPIPRSLSSPGLGWWRAPVQLGYYGPGREVPNVYRVGTGGWKKNSWRIPFLLPGASPQLVLSPEDTPLVGLAVVLGNGSHGGARAGKECGPPIWEAGRGPPGEPKRGAGL